MTRKCGYVRHFHEKLSEEHGIELSYTWVKLALQGAGLVKQRSRRGAHRRRRPRRSLPGMLLHIDASKHAWCKDTASFLPRKMQARYENSSDILLRN